MMFRTQNKGIWSSEQGEFRIQEQGFLSSEQCADQI